MEAALTPKNVRNNTPNSDASDDNSVSIFVF